jgi:hypothetical protein
VLGRRKLRLSIPGIAVCDQLKLSVLIGEKAGPTFIDDAFLTIHAIPK